MDQAWSGIGGGYFKVRNLPLSIAGHISKAWIKIMMRLYKMGDDSYFYK